MSGRIPQFTILRIKSLAVTPAQFVEEQDSGISHTFAPDSPNHTVSVFDLLVSSSSRNSLPHLGLRQLSFFSSAAIRHDVRHHAFITMFSIICRLIPRHLGNLLVHVLLQLLQCRASLGTTAVDFTLFPRSFTCCVRTGGPGDSGGRAPLSACCVWRSLTSCHQPSSLSLWVCSFLGVLQALLMIDFSSIIVFLCASLGPGAFCCVLQHHASSISLGRETKTHT